MQQSGNSDIRWKQRFGNFKKALALLQKAVEQYHQSGLSELEQEGLIQRFEFTYELAWNVIKDYFGYQGIFGISGPRDAVREAFSKGLISDGEGWMEMIKSRNLSTYTYDEATTKSLVGLITVKYLGLFQELADKMNLLP